MKLEELKPSTRKTIRRIAAASGLNEKEVLRRMLKPSSANGVTTHLNYGV